MKKYFVKMISLSLSVILAASAMAACGSSPNEKGAEENEAVQQENE